MKTIIAGARGYDDYETVVAAVVASGFDVTEVVCGGAAGVDFLGRRFAEERSIPCRVFLADWEKYGRAAGPIRNALMAKYADALVAVTSGGPGSTNMIRIAQNRGLRVHVQWVNGGAQ